MRGSSRHGRVIAVYVQSKNSTKFFTQSYDPWGWCWVKDILIAEDVPIERRKIRPEKGITSINRNRYM